MPAKGLMLGFLMLKSESLCLSTQCVISLRLKLKWELNALLPEHVGFGTLAFKYSSRNFLEARNVVRADAFVVATRMSW
jgi:hypothetical protein